MDNFEVVYSLFESKFFSTLATEIESLGSEFSAFEGVIRTLSKILKDADANSLKSLNNIKSLYSKWSIVFSALGSSIRETFTYANDAKEMKSLMITSGINPNKFQSILSVAKQYGENNHDVSNSISHLNDNLLDVKNGGSGNGLKTSLEMYKINPDVIKTSEQLLDVISAKMKDLKTDAEKINLADSLGLDQSLIPLLENGINAYSLQLEKSSKYNLFSEEDLQRAEELTSSLTGISLGFSSIIKNVYQLLLPILVPLMNGLKTVIDFFAENSEMIKVSLLEIAAVVASFLVPPIMSLAASLFVSLAPLLLIISGIMVLNYVLGQLWAWISGKPSMFDKWLGSFETFKEGVISGLKQLKHKWITIFMEMWDKMPAILKFFFKNLTFPGLLVQGAMAVKGFQNRKKRKSATAAAGLDYVPYDGYVAELHKGESVLNKSESNVWRDLMLGKDAIAATANIPLASIPQGAIAGAYSNSTTTKNFTIGDITIQTQATDAEGIANDLLQNIKMAFNGLDTGVRA